MAVLRHVELSGGSIIHHSSSPMYPQNGDLTNLLKSAPECPFECGWGGAKAKRAMPKCPQHEFEGGFPKRQLRFSYNILVGL